MSDPCPGPLVWFDVAPNESRRWELAGILECNTCDYLIVTGNLNDSRHNDAGVLREGL